MVGLADDMKLFYQCNEAGVDFVHIKCGEIGSVVYHPCMVVYKENVVKPDYALALFERETPLFEILRIVYMTPTTLRVEGNIKLSKGENIELETGFEEPVLFSNKFVVRNVSRIDVVYNYAYAYDIDYIYAEKPKKDDLEETCDSPEELEIMLELEMDVYKTKLENSKKNLTEFITSRINDFRPPNVRILLIDKNISIFDDPKNHFDMTPYKINFQSKLGPGATEVGQFRPDIIAFQLVVHVVPDIDDETIPEDEQLSLEEREELLEKIKSEEAEQMSWVKAMIAKIDSIKNYEPPILLFNCKKLNSTKLQETYSYDHIQSMPDKFSMELINLMAQKVEQMHLKVEEEQDKVRYEELKKKEPEKYKDMPMSEVLGPKVFLKDTSRLRVAKIAHQVTLTSMTEAEITCKSERPLMRQAYKTNFPIDMSVTIFPREDEVADDKNMQSYRGFIHSIGEIERQEVRQFVYDVFFADLNEKRRVEKEEQEQKIKDLEKERDQTKEEEDGDRTP